MFFEMLTKSDSLDKYSIIRSKVTRSQYYVQKRVIRRASSSAEHTGEVSLS